MLGLFEGEILEQTPEEIRAQWKKGNIDPLPETIGKVPPGVAPTGNVSPAIYNAYRLGRMSACGDIVIVTRLPDGTGAVLLSKRNDNACFPSVWWIYGGALPAYQDPAAFVATRAKGECGVPVQPQVLLGVYITSSAGERPEHNGSTLNILYAAQVPYELIERHRSTDEGHSDVRVFTLAEYNALPAPERHWYVDRAAQLAIENMP